MSRTDTPSDGTIRDIEMPGGAIRAEIFGSGPALLFLHGWTLDRRIWAPQAKALADRFRVVLIDRRGCGESSAPPDLTREADDIARIADVLGLERFALVGMSQGARVALAFALKQDDRLRALVLQGAPLSGSPGSAGELPIRQMTELAASGKLAKLRTLWRAHPLMQVRGTSANALLDEIVSGYIGRDLLATPVALDIHEHELSQILLPTLVITGANEPAGRHHVAEILHRCLHAQRLNIPRAGHLANLCDPEAYNMALIDFLETMLQ